jgi:hypothetical protein
MKHSKASTMRSVVATAAVAGSLLTGCGSGAGEAGRRCVTDDGTRSSDLRTVSPSEAQELTVAEVLRRDERFSQFRKLAEETSTQIAVSFLEIWDRPTDSFGNEVWTTVFVPADTAFAVLDPDILAAFRQGRLDRTTSSGTAGLAITTCSGPIHRRSSPRVRREIGSRRERGPGRTPQARAGRWMSS